MFIEKLRGNMYLGGGEDEKRPALPFNGRSFSNNILPEKDQYQYQERYNKLKSQREFYFAWV
jgi:hypothetical protein